MKTAALLPCLFTLALSAAEPVPEFTGGIERLDPAFDKLVAPDARVEVLATGFNWSEGPVWKDGQLVFSDVPENTALLPPLADDFGLDRIPPRIKIRPELRGGLRRCVRAGLQPLLHQRHGNGRRRPFEKLSPPGQPAHPRFKT